MQAVACASIAPAWAEWQPGPRRARYPQSGASRLHAPPPCWGFVTIAARQAPRLDRWHFTLGAVTRLRIARECFGGSTVKR